MKGILTALFWAFSLFVHAEMVDTYQFQNAQDRTRAVNLAKSLRCPQCQNQNLVESNSPIAYDLRLEVYKMVDEGKTDAQIIEAMTGRFGDFVNYNPPFRWNTALLWGLPAGLLILAIGLVYFSKRRGRLVAMDTQDTSPQTALISTPPDFSRKQGIQSNAVYVALTILMLALSFGYYATLDRFERVQAGEREMIAQHNQQIERLGETAFEDRIEKLQNKLRADPNNAELWLQLGEAYGQNNEFQYALIAYENAEKLQGVKPAILGLKATALFYLAGQQITPEVAQLLNAALSGDKNEVASLSLLATAAFETRDYAQAKYYWQQLLDSGKASVDRRSVISRMKMIEFLQKGQTL